MLLLEVYPLELFLCLHDLSMGSLLQAVEAGHQYHRGEKDAYSDHEAQEYFIVQVIGRKCRLYCHLISYVHILSLWNPVAYLL